VAVRTIGVASAGRPVSGLAGASRAVTPPPSLVGGGEPRDQVAEIQRKRLLEAVVREVDERGYAAATVAHITARARVSRRTFYELFADREACLAAAFLQTVALLDGELGAAGLAGRPWRERIRGGLEVILGCLDRAPALARVCVVHTMQAGPLVLEHRQAVLARLIATVEEDRPAGSHAAGCSGLTAEGVVGAVLAIVHARLARRDRARLLGLTSELTAMIVLPYLGGAAARRERQRAAPTPSQADAGQLGALAGVDPLAGVAIRFTYRTMRILQGARHCPGASNRQLAALAGVQDQGQVSKLLARLQRLELLTNRGSGHAKGEPNAWVLTAKGEQVVQSIAGREAIDTFITPPGRARR
jgi:AcrR family transcriptional regulator